MSVESKVDYDDLQDMVASNDSGGEPRPVLRKKPLCMSPFFGLCSKFIMLLHCRLYSKNGLLTQALI